MTYNSLSGLIMSNKYSNGKLTIGIFSNTLDFEFQILVWAGVQAAAKIVDANMICFAGAELKTPNLIRNERNTVYEMIGTKNVNGLIILPSINCSFLTMEEINEYFEKYHNMPIVSIGMHLKNISSIIIDNKYGFKSLVDHLIEVHNRRKFLYIGGPVNNLEAIDRLNAFKESLNDHQITINPEHITVADYLLQPAYSIVHNLLNQKFDFDAIVAANDSMAMGAIKALQEKKVVIPDEISVIGFDDINIAHSLLIPLTTVRQPVYEMTRKAIDIIIKKIDGKKVKDLEIIKTEPVIRNSCGCMTRDINHVIMKNLKPNQSGISDFKNIKNEVLIELKENHSFTSKFLSIYNNIIEDFFKVVQSEVSDNDFIIKFDKTLRICISNNFDNSVWDELFFLIRKKIQPFFLNQPDKIIQIDDLIFQLCILNNNVLKQIENNSHIQLLERTRILQRIMRELVNSFNIQNLVEKLATELPKIGIKSCYLSLHSSKEKMFKEARLILAYNKNGRIKLDNKKSIFPSQELFPRDLIKIDERFDLIIESLVYEKEQLGFVVFEIDPLEGILITSVSDQITSTIKASMLLQETLEKGKKLEQILSELKEQHKELEETYEKLKENQKKLIIADKMASLGRLTAGIAHEMSTPLATARGSLAEIVNLIKEYKISLSNTDITIKDHNEIADDMLKTVTLADKAIGKASGFIKSIKSQTREDDYKEKIFFNVVNIINETILLLSHILKQNNLSIGFNFSNGSISLFGNPGKFSQVITNLIINAIDAVASKKGKSIKIDLSEDKKNVILRIEDNGCGILEENITKIFDPLFTTKPFGHGSGLGLTIVQDIVYREYNGYIEVESKVDYGTIFTIIIIKPAGHKNKKKFYYNY